MNACVRSSLAALCLLAFAGCASDLDIVHGLNELEANEIIVVLGGEGITAMKAKEEGRVVTWAVIVNESEGQNALSLLVRNKLPRERSQGLAEVYPAGSGGLIPTRSEEKAKFLMAAQGEIERKLKSLPGVVRAHVSIVVPDKDVIRDLDAKPPPGDRLGSDRVQSRLRGRRAGDPEPSESAGGRRGRRPRYGPRRGPAQGEHRDFHHLHE